MSWATIHGILSSAPTAGDDVLRKIVDARGDILKHIDQESLPGGSVEGLLEAIASLPPGQARKLVSEIAKEPQVYLRSLLYNNDRLLGSMTVEQEDMNLYVNFQVTCRTDDGNLVPMDPGVASWFSKRLGRKLS